MDIIVTIRVKCEEWRVEFWSRTLARVKCGKRISIFCEAFPEELEGDLYEVLKIMPQKTYSNVKIYSSEEMLEYRSGCADIKIPYRIYAVDIEPGKVKGLSEIQKQILYCIYTRSCDGFIREKYLKELLKTDFSYWAIPFIVKLCDEYVVEILHSIYDMLKDRNNEDIINFCLENKSACKKSYDRMVSYWDVYYRGYEKNLKKYIGRKLFAECLGYRKKWDK